LKKLRQKKHKLRVYLFKKRCNKIGDVVKDPKSLRKFTIKNYNIDEMVLYVGKSYNRMPKWVNFFNGYLDEELSDLFVASSSAALIVRYNDLYFAFVFGYGRNLLCLQNIEESFGLKVALNSIDDDKIRSIDIKNLDTVLRHTRIQTSQASSVDTFGMDIDQDILNNITGSSIESDFGGRISGSIAFSLSAPIIIRELKDLCNILLEKFRSKKYKKKFPWVDHISEVKNNALRDELNNYLVKTIKKKDLENIFLAVPELIAWESVEGFKYTETDILREDINLFDILPSNDKIESTISLAWLKRKKVLCVDSSGEQIIYHWPLYKCINFEFRKEQEIYLLTGGKWFKINTQYADSVTDHIKNIPEYNDFAFPEYQGEGEPAYNAKACGINKKNCYLMDRKMILYGGGYSRIEFCDLLVNRSDFIHVKRFRGPSALSHLFLQGFNAAFLFLSDRDFRAKVNDILPKNLAFENIEEIHANDYQIVFAIISKNEGKAKDILPFFSKVSLLRIYKELKAYGFNVSVKKIGMKQENVRK